MAFTQENTSGYTDAQLTDINDKWTDVVERLSLEDGTDEYSDAEKRFDEAVNRCDHMDDDGIDWAAVYAQLYIASDEWLAYAATAVASDQSRK